MSTRCLLLIFLLASATAEAGGPACSLLHEEDLRDLHVPGAKPIEKSTTVPSSAYGTSEPVPLSECEYWGSDPNSGRPPEGNISTVWLSVTILPVDVATRLQDTLKKNYLEARDSAPTLPTEVTYDNDGKVNCAVLISPPLSMCAGYATNARITIQFDRLESEPATTAKVRKYFDLIAERFKHG